MTQQMHISKVSRQEAAQARGVVIVIDVIRAFSVAGYAFAGGARALWLVRTVDEAFALREREPSALLAGEVGGKLIPGFDLNNSPAMVKRTNVNGRLIIQRTGAGTQGAVGAESADHLLLCALTNAQATAHYARKLAASNGGIVSLIPTGDISDFAFGSEDVFCADYIEALLQDRANAADLLARGTEQLRDSNRFELWKKGDQDFPLEDISAVLDANRFNFAIVGERKAWQGIEYVEARRVDIA